MKIKIEKFNFISNKDNIVDSYTDLQDYMKYFYLDGISDTLFVTNYDNFEKIDSFDFEKELLRRYKVVNLNKDMKSQINKYIDNKVDELYYLNNYSKYKLYKKMTFDKIKELKDNNFSFLHEDYLEINFDTNKINYGAFQYNPYTQKVENLETLFNERKFDELISKKLILKEIENDIAPKFITELIKIEDFLKEKQSIKLMFNNINNFKCTAKITEFLYERGLFFELNFYDKTKENFLNENPTKRVEDLKIEDLKGIMYSNKILEINGSNFLNIDKQIAISLDDRFEQKIDKMEKENENNYYNSYSKITRIPTELNGYMPNVLFVALSAIKEAEKYNNNYPSWYTQDIEEIIKKSYLIQELKETKSLKDAKKIAISLNDNELISILNEFPEKENELEEEEVV
ncbi:MAG: hypothetical protein Q4G09_00230 [Clostridia bacterium]|nr:hypothetical protein [Clostridia bacterium]